VPSTVSELFGDAGLESAGVVRWGTTPFPAGSVTVGTGIYIVALTGHTDSLEGTIATAPISASAVEDLLAVRPELTLDGVRPTPVELIQRLAAFWFPDEVVLYIGLAGPRKSRPGDGELARRIEEYYDTPLGARTPHSGGWPLKTLSCLTDLYVHYTYCDRVNDAEHECLAEFVGRVSDATLASLRDRVRVMPFANLEYPKGNRKNHGIKGARAPRATRSR
jgi:hypothetical protein